MERLIGIIERNGMPASIGYSTLVTNKHHLISFRKFMLGEKEYTDD